MKTVFTLFRKECAIFFRYRSGVIITFLVPIILIYLFGWVFGLNKSGSSAPSGIPLVVVNASAEPAAKVLVQALEKEKTFKVITTNTDAPGGPRPVSEEDARLWLRNNDQRFALILPADFTSDERLGLRMVFLNNPRNEIETTIVTGMVQKTIFSNLKDLLSRSLVGSARRHFGAEKFDKYNAGLADLVSTNFGGDRDTLLKRFNEGDYFGGAFLDSQNTKPASPASEPKAEKSDDSADEFLSRIVAIENEQVAGKQVKNPAAARLIGGYAIMFLLFAVSGFSTSFFGERSSGIFHRILATRARRHHILWAKFLFCVFLGLFQLSSLFLFGEAIYKLDLFHHLLPLTLMCLCAASACAAFGMLIASVSTNPQAANGLATMLVLTMSAIGGAWFPISFMPDFIQSIAKFTVVYWSVEGFTNILWADYGIIQSLPFMGVLLLMTLLCQSIAIWRFRKGDMFG